MAKNSRNPDTDKRTPLHPLAEVFGYLRSEEHGAAHFELQMLAGNLRSTNG